MTYRPHRSIVVIPMPETDERTRDEVAWQYTYSGRALASKLPHGSSCPCLMCADCRRAIGHIAIDPAPDLSRIARRILERAAERDEVRIRLGPGIQYTLRSRLPVGPTLTASAGVGALLGATLFLMVLS